MKEKNIVSTVTENLPNTIKESDGVLSTIVGFFNHVILYPVQKANIYFKYKLEHFEEDIKKKMSAIPPENIKQPPINIVGPTLEALRYSYDEEEIRELFENLLVSSMNTTKYVYPSYVEIIKQLTSDEAKILKKLMNNNTIPLIDIQLHLPGEGGYHILMSNFTNIAEGICDFPEKIFSYLDNLHRLGLIEIPFGVHLADESMYDILENHSQVLAYKNAYYPEGYKIKTVKKKLAVTNFGNDFINSCVK